MVRKVSHRNRSLPWTLIMTDDLSRRDCFWTNNFSQVCVCVCVWYQNSHGNKEGAVSRVPYAVRTDGFCVSRSYE